MAPSTVAVTNWSSEDSRWRELDRRDKLPNDRNIWEGRASITSSQRIIFGPNAHFTGTVQYRNLSVSAGAIINGALIPLVEFDNDTPLISQNIE